MKPDTTLRTDICIVGTGMGAISVANSLVGAGRSVLFIETGPIRASRRDRPALHIENVGRPFGISTSRGLEVGGGTAFWHGVCAPLDEQDFLERPWIPHSGWPIGRSDLAPWYAVALDFLCGASQDGPGGTDGPGSSALQGTDVFDAKTYRFRSPPFRGKETLRRWCDQGLVRCVYHSTALQLLQEHGRSHTLVVGSGGHRFTVKADRFVIAAGALETPRLLLNSLRKPDVPLPATPWWLGRNLIDHPAGYLSQVTFHRPFAGKPGVEGESAPEVQAFPGFMLRGEVQRTRQLPNHAVFVRKGISRRPVPNKAVMSFLGVRGPRDVALSHLKSLVRHPYIIWRIAHQKLPLSARSRYGDLFFMTEQLPNPHSQVSLSAKSRDEFGFPIARVNWRLSDQDIAMFAEYHELLMSSLRGHDEVRGLRSDPLARWEDTVASAAHHLGTARMGSSARDGVVDRNLKVFGFDNVWISDGSVFPTAGSVNPSLTICALGHRLGAHLNRMRA
ncbi:GMC oxidoreductase [Massilia niastensis]|uniref:GMC oxidoreductase n=1 Tax=Massilia niastensis TaxID=544911 RepID=UPI001E45249A|nr:GMC family oxidoreductase [Massilia niastensis]